jgi:DNA mismatch repair protein MutS
LKQIGDLERLISKVAVRRINPREMLQLKKALSHIDPIKGHIQEALLDFGNDLGADVLRRYSDQLNPCHFLLEKIQKELRDEVPIVTNQGNMIREGVDADLDALLKVAYSGKDFLIQLQNREIERTGITSLKISFNKVFGYYLEVTNSHKDKVPIDWIRKQTLVNAERYITPELKEYEETILGAEDKIFVIEQRIFNDLVNVANEYVLQIQQNARMIAVLDVLTNFAKVAEKITTLNLSLPTQKYWKSRKVATL